MFKVQKLRDDAIIPSRAHPEDAGLDIHCVDSFTLLVGEYKLVHTGIAIEIPKGYEAQIRPRSGLAMKQGITVLNAPGTIDSNYRGEVGVVLINLGSAPSTFKQGDRIAQMVFARVDLSELTEVDTLNKSTRGTSGFGSTGV
jgi:dUTP pyrophosphatase